MMLSSSFDFFPQRVDLVIRKLLGRSLLREFRLEEAFVIYLSILKDHPEDFYILLVLANVYLRSGSPGTARSIYNLAIKHGTIDPSFETQIAEAQIAALESVEEPSPLSADGLARLLVRLRGEVTPKQVEEICAAADPFEKLLDEEMPEQNSTWAGEGVNLLMPALLEQQRRQAFGAGMVEVASALQSLQIHLSHSAMSDTEPNEPLHQADEP